MECVTIELSDSTAESLDFVANTKYGGDRNAAARALIDEWLERPR